MKSEGFKRKLSAILSADAVAYSRLMAEDESSTVKTLEEYKAVMFTLIKQHRGRVLASILADKGILGIQNIIDGKWGIYNIYIKGALWHFDRTDIIRVAKIVGSNLPFMGNVPASLTTTGTPEEMTDYCKDLIQTCGPTNNFILTNGSQIDEARDENLKAMIASIQG